MLGLLSGAACCCRRNHNVHVAGGGNSTTPNSFSGAANKAHSSNLSSSEPGLSQANDNVARGWRVGAEGLTSPAASQMAGQQHHRHRIDSNYGDEDGGGDDGSWRDFVALRSPITSQPMPAPATNFNECYNAHHHSGVVGGHSGGATDGGGQRFVPIAVSDCSDDEAEESNRSAANDDNPIPPPLTNTSRSYPPPSPPSAGIMHSGPRQHVGVEDPTYERIMANDTDMSTYNHGDGVTASDQTSSDHMMYTLTLPTKEEQQRRFAAQVTNLMLARWEDNDDSEERMGTLYDEDDDGFGEENAAEERQSGDDARESAATAKPPEKQELPSRKDSHGGGHSNAEVGGISGSEVAAHESPIIEGEKVMWSRFYDDSSSVEDEVKGVESPKLSSPPEEEEEEEEELRSIKMDLSVPILPPCATVIGGGNSVVFANKALMQRDSTDEEKEEEKTMKVVEWGRFDDAHHHDENCNNSSSDIIVEGGEGGSPWLLNSHNWTTVQPTLDHIGEQIGIGTSNSSQAFCEAVGIDTAAASAEPMEPSPPPSLLLQQTTTTTTDIFPFGWDTTMPQESKLSISGGTTALALVGDDQTGHLHHHRVSTNDPAVAGAYASCNASRQSTTIIAVGTTRMYGSVDSDDEE